ncbi:hypothetical protein BDU57DRAFT_536181 [Ampelomyces quisqualis]|uniref:Uncharacterized protein n=1 Tax=Ampelomyces quisqualis TaxID=50730 RepID=A0A6A5QWG2_AMPQU|nr:hypothetical protein BDU57DRAFT_536181 [Ampelomyces quisqualis]
MVPNEMPPSSENSDGTDDVEEPDIKKRSGNTFVLTGDDPGSQNGVGLDYLLAQNKAQLGDNKVIFNIKVFGKDVPSLLFWVADSPEQGPSVLPGKSPDSHMKSRSVSHSDNGK